MTSENKTVLVRATTPRGEIQLQRRSPSGGNGPPVYEVIFNGVFLTASYNCKSERALARLAIESLLAERRDEIRVLVGGLGIGYTLQAALAYPQVRQVDVVEIEPLIVGWARDYFAELNGRALADPRVRVVVADLADHLARTGDRYDAIALDVDNGPRWLAMAGNAALYSVDGLRRLRDMLTEGGVLTVWSAGRCEDFARRLMDVFGVVGEICIEDVDPRGQPTDYFVYRARWVGQRETVGFS